MTDLKEKLKVKGWWEYLPIIGNIAYSMRIELYLNKVYLDNPTDPEIKRWKKTTKKYKSIFNLVTIIIALSFIIPFFVLRNTHGYGAWPWFFWVGMPIAMSANLTPFISIFLYKKGYKEYLKTMDDDKK